MNLPMIVIKTGYIDYYINQPFKKSKWKKGFLYLIKQKSFYLAIFKTKPVIENARLIDWKNKKSKIVVLFNEVSKKTKIKKLSIKKVIRSRSPSNFVIKVDIGIFWDLMICFQNSVEINAWLETLSKSISDSMNQTKVKRFKSLMGSIRLKASKMRKIERSAENINTFHVYRVITDPLSNSFDNLYRGLLEFDTNEMILYVARYGKEKVELKFPYTEISKYGSSENTFMFEFLHNYNKTTYILSLNGSDVVKKKFVEFTSKYAETAQTNQLLDNMSDVSEKVYKNVFAQAKLDTIYEDVDEEQHKSCQELQDKTEIIPNSNLDTTERVESYLETNSESKDEESFPVESNTIKNREIDGLVNKADIHEAKRSEEFEPKDEKSSETDVNENIHDIIEEIAQKMDETTICAKIESDIDENEGCSCKWSAKGSDESLDESETFESTKVYMDEDENIKDTYKIDLTSNEGFEKEKSAEISTENLSNVKSIAKYFEKLTNNSYISSSESSHLTNSDSSLNSQKNKPSRSTHSDTRSHD